MEDSNLAKQDDADPRPFAFANLRTKSDKERFDIRPADGSVNGSGEYQFQCRPVPFLHEF